jgi:hypothetical protein
MAETYDIKALAEIISSLRRDTEKLKEIGSGIPTLQKNANRILYHVKMLEINISEVTEILGK